VGCGSRPTGDVNVDFFAGGWNSQEGNQKQGEFMNPHLISNFVAAHAEFLPFKDECFDIAFSSHVIEHVENPSKMIMELLRVSKRKVVVRCPHRKGSGAKRPFHINYLDEDWFMLSLARLGYQAKTFVTQDYYPVTSRMMLACPESLLFLFGRNIISRVVRKTERKILSNDLLKFPFELEVQVTKQRADDVIFVVVYNDEQILHDCFLSSVGVNNNNIIAYHNRLKKGLPEVFNGLLQTGLLEKDRWIVFCHQDFVLHEPLRVRLIGKNKLGVYGVIGCRVDTPKFRGQIIQTDGSTTGGRLLQDTPVETLDELCLIVHSQAFREGLRFDNQFTFHFYGADLCMQANNLGFDVMAIQVACQHKSKTLSGDIHSAEYFEMLKRQHG
jgi:SAM-dependent methyltransferase